MIAKSTDEPCITYRLLCDGTGIVTEGFLNVSPREKKLKISFEISTPHKKEDLVGAYLVLESDDKVQYRAIYDCITDVHLSTLSGKVSLAVSSGAAKKLWRCEPLTAQPLSDGSIAVLPFDINEEKKISDIRVELSEIKRRLCENEEKTSAFDDRLTEIMNGYDLV